MKKLIFLMFCLVSFQAMASTIEAEVVSAKFGIEDENHHPNLCLTVVKMPADGEIIGIIEDIYDCFYARSAKKSHIITIRLNDLHEAESSELLTHLQSLDGQLKFLFSAGE